MKWIPVDESLPEERKVVLVVIQDDQGTQMAFGFMRNGKWSETEDSGHYAVVTHWMQLPPKPEPHG